MDSQFIFSKTLNKNVPIPLYYQLKELLIEYVDNSPEHTLLPTENQLSEHFEISRSTVRQALGELSADGLLVRHKGKGTMVATRKIEQEFLAVLESFNDEMKEKGLTPWTRVVEFLIEPSKPGVAAALNLSKNDRVVKLVRLRGTEEEPVVLVSTYIPADVGDLSKLVNEDLVNSLLYHLLEVKYGIEILSSRRTLEIRFADHFESVQLGVERNAPLHHIETISTDTKGRIIEFSVAKYTAANNRFVIEVRNKRI